MTAVEDLQSATAVKPCPAPRVAHEQPFRHSVGCWRGAPSSRHACQGVSSTHSCSGHPLAAFVAGRAEHCDAVRVDRPVRTPSPFELDVIVNSVRDAWQKQKSPMGIERDSRWLLYAIFHPERCRKSGSLVIRRSSVRLWPNARTRTRRAQLAAECPATVAEGRSTAAQIQAMLKAELGTASSPRIREWQRRVEKYGLLSP